MLERHPQEIGDLLIVFEENLKLADSAGMIRFRISVALLPE